MKKALAMTRGGVILGIVACSAFLLAQIVSAGGPVETTVIDHTRLEELREAYNRDMRLPQISATYIEGEPTTSVIDIAAAAADESMQNKTDAFKITKKELLIFFVFMAALLSWFLWMTRMN